MIHVSELSQLIQKIKVRVGPNFGLYASDEIVEWFRANPPNGVNVKFTVWDSPVRFQSDLSRIPLSMGGTDLNPTWFNAPIELVAAFVNGEPSYFTVPRPQV